MMVDKLNVLYLPSPDPDFPKHFDNEVIAAVGERHHLTLFDHQEELAPQFTNIDVVIDLGGSVGTRAMLDACDRVRLWQVLGMGIDHFDLEYWKQQGMPVANCPGPLSAVGLAESALMFMLMLARGYPEARKNIESGVQYAPFGFELEGRTLLLVGFGASARELSVRAKPFGLRVLGVDIEPPAPEEATALGAEYVGQAEELDELLPQADFVSVHLPLNAATRHIINGRRLSLMRDSAYIINVARGALIDEDAMVEALSGNRLAGAGLDVFAQEPLPIGSPLLSMPNVILTPHIAGATDGTARRRAEAAAENCDRVAEGLEPLHRVG